MSCCRFCFIIIPAFFTLVTIVLTALSCAGTSENNKLLTSIYYIDLNLSDLNATAILSDSSISSEVTSIVNSVDTSINKVLGLSDVYSFGMWGYCKGDLTGSLSEYDTANVNFTYCSKPKAMYIFNPAAVIFGDMTNESEDDSNSDLNDIVSALKDIGISLPSGVEDYMKLVKPLSKLIFICTIIGLVLSFICLVLSVVTICSKSCSCFVFILSVLSFISLILAAAASTLAFVYIRKEFNNAVSQYGITANLSRNYLVFYWIAILASLVATIFWLFSICCCSTGFRRRYDVVEKL